MQRFTFAGLVALVATLSMPVASADVVGEPPSDCPAYSSAQTCHGGPYCAPITCTSDADCNGVLTCQALPLCMDTIGCAGLLPPDASPDDFRSDQVLGACGDGTCSTGMCETVSVCAPPGTDPANPDGGGGSSGGGCAISLSAAPGGIALSAVAVGLLLLRRRRIAR